MGGSGQQENLYQPLKSGSYPLRLTTFLGDAPQAELGTLLPVYQMLVCLLLLCFKGTSFSTSLRRWLLSVHPGRNNKKEHTWGVQG